MSQSATQASLRIPLAGLLAWLVPGLGHLYIGDRARGLIFMITISATFWAGIAIGGAGSTVDPQHRRLWFAAQLLTGGQSLVAVAIHQNAIAPYPESEKAPVIGHWLSIDVGTHYTGVAGLLNFLVILDAIFCADPTTRKLLAMADSQGSVVT